MHLAQKLIVNNRTERLPRDGCGSVAPRVRLPAVATARWRTADPAAAAAAAAAAAMAAVRKRESSLRDKMTPKIDRQVKMFKNLGARPSPIPRGGLVF